MNKVTGVIWFYLAFFLWSPSHAQLFVRGRLVDEASKKPIAFANISITHSAIGTASDERGHFFLKVDPEFYGEKIKLSYIGYNNRYLSIDSLARTGQQDLVIVLHTAALYLEEVVVDGSRMEPVELLKEAIKAIPQNYSQTPFNLEFYSKVEVKDSLETVYQVESILLAYRKAYKEGAWTWCNILQKREKGISPLIPDSDKKTNREYFPLPPGFPISLIDMPGTGATGVYTVFNPARFKRMDFISRGISLFDRDTVCAIEYVRQKKDIKDAEEEPNVRYGGVIYIALNNLAIIRHKLKMNNTSYDIVYKKSGSFYYPYSIRFEGRGNWPSAKGKYTVFQSVFLQRIITDNVSVIGSPKETGVAYYEDVPYDQIFWDQNFPVR